MSELSTDPWAVKARQRRIERGERGICVNGCGPATHGVRCHRCRLVHRYGILRARHHPEWESAPPRKTERRLKSIERQEQEQAACRK